MGCVCGKSSIPVVLDYEGIREQLPVIESQEPVAAAISADPEENVALVRAGADEAKSEANVPLLPALSANSEQNVSLLKEGFGETTGIESEDPVIGTISVKRDRNARLVRAGNGEMGRESQVPASRARSVSTEMSATGNRERSVTSAVNREWNVTSMNRRGKVSLVKAGTGNIMGRRADNKFSLPTRAGNDYFHDQQRRIPQGWGTLGNIRSIPNAVEAEQIAAGWPTWLVAVGKDAIRGWVPREEDSYEKLEMLGQGTYSCVYRARDLLQNNKIVALKEVRFQIGDPISVEFMTREILLLRRLDHPNIIKIEAVVTSRTSSTFYLVFEYMEHDLLGLSTLPGVKFTESQVKCLMRQLLCGLDYCHNNGVLHRDLKLSNILMDNNGVLKIADFGLATLYDCQQRVQLTSRVVTLWYRAPELLLGATRYGSAIDLWSTGCILGELYARRPLMPGDSEVDQLHKIFKLCGSPSAEYWRNSRLPYVSMVNTRKIYRRQIVESFRNVSDSALRLMEILLSINPHHRGTARTALRTEYFMTEPRACAPSSLPQYPKFRVEELRPEGQGSQGQEVESKPTDANAELQRKQEQLRRRIAYFNSLKDDEATPVYYPPTSPSDISVEEIKIEYPKRPPAPLAQVTRLPSVFSRPDLQRIHATNQAGPSQPSNQLVVANVPNLDPRLAPRVRNFSPGPLSDMEEYVKDHDQLFERRFEAVEEVQFKSYYQP